MWCCICHNFFPKFPLTYIFPKSPQKSPSLTSPLCYLSPWNNISNSENSRASHGRSLSLMSFSQCHHHPLRFFIRREDHHSSMTSPWLDISALPHWSLIREAKGPYLQQLGEYFLHSRWKGSRLLHRFSECYLHIRWKGPRFLHQHRQHRGASSPWSRRRWPVIPTLTSLILIPALLPRSFMRSFRKRRLRTTCCSRSYRWHSGQSHI